MAKAISEKKPWRSKTCGVHPEQVTEVREFAKKNGYDYKVYDDGSLEATSNKGRNDIIKTFPGCVDHDGGYGDYTGPSRE